MKASGLAETSCRQRRRPYSRTFARRQLLARGARAYRSCSHRRMLQPWRAASRVLVLPLGLGSLFLFPVVSRVPEILPAEILRQTPKPKIPCNRVQTRRTKTKTVAMERCSTSGTSASQKRWVTLGTLLHGTRFTGRLCYLRKGRETWPWFFLQNYNYA